MKKAAYLSFILFFSSCATLYQPKGFGGGYTQTQLNDNKYQVRFGCNGYSSKSFCNDMALLRSAELAVDNNYNYFLIIDNDNSVSNSSFTTPQQSVTTVYGAGNTAIANTSYYGGQTINISKPSTTNTIILVNENSDAAYNAKLIIKNMCGKYYKSISTKRTCLKSE